MDEEKLIVLVQKQECLYNLQNKDYDNNNVKENIWKDIAVHMNSSSDDCKSRWALLRSYYRRALSRRKTVSGQAAKKIKKWRFEDQMQFLQSCMQDRELTTNLEDQGEELTESEYQVIDDDAAPSPSVSVASSGTSSKKRKTPTPGLADALTSFIQLKTTRQEVEPPNSLAKINLMRFMEDICESLLKFPELDQVEMKREIFTLVNNKELEILKRKNQSQATGAGEVGFQSQYCTTRPTYAPVAGYYSQQNQSGASSMYKTFENGLGEIPISYPNHTEK